MIVPIKGAEAQSPGGPRQQKYPADHRQNACCYPSNNLTNLNSNVIYFLRLPLSIKRLRHIVLQ